MSRMEMATGPAKIWLLLAFFVVATVLALGAGTRLPMREILMLAAVFLGGVSILWLARAGWHLAQRQLRTGSRLAKITIAAVLGLVYYAVSFILVRLLYDPVEKWAAGTSVSALSFARVSGAGGGWLFFLAMLAFALSVAIFVRPKPK